MLTRQELIKGIRDLDSYLSERDLKGEIAVYGGACLCLAYSARASTKDVDAVFQPSGIMRKAIFEVSLANGWDWNWMNDDVAGFLSDQHEADRTLPEFDDLQNLHVVFPQPDYLLAMKCFAARAGDDEEPSPDLADARWLAKKLSIQSREEILQILSRFYPDKELPPRVDFFIHEVIAQLND